MNYYYHTHGKCFINDKHVFVCVCVCRLSVRIQQCYFFIFMNLMNCFCFLGPHKVFNIISVFKIVFFIRCQCSVVMIKSFFFFLRSHRSCCPHYCSPNTSFFSLGVVDWSVDLRSFKPWRSLDLCLTSNVLGSPSLVDSSSSSRVLNCLRYLNWLRSSEQMKSYRNLDF